MAKNFEVVVNKAPLEELLKSLRGQHVKVVSDGVEYGVYQELGYMAGGVTWVQHPFLVPALEQVRPGFVKAVSQAIEKGGDMIDAVVDKAAQDVVALARINAPVDTGALKNSIMVHDPEDI